MNIKDFAKIEYFFGLVCIYGFILPLIQKTQYANIISAIIIFGSGSLMYLSIINKKLKVNDE